MDESVRGLTIYGLLAEIAMEPPYADPHVRWCGRGGSNDPPYPINAIAAIINGDIKETIKPAPAPNANPKSPPYSQPTPNTTNYAPKKEHKSSTEFCIY